VLGRVVLHSHPVYVNAFTCMAGGEAALRETLGEAPLWVSYATPGYALGAAVDAAARGAGEAKAEAIFLASHGLIVAGPEAEGVMALTGRMCEAGASAFGPLPEGAVDKEAAPAGLLKWGEALGEALKAGGLLGANGIARPARFGALHAAASEPERWLAAGPLVPDDVVYCGPRIGVARDGETAAGWLEGLGGAEEVAGRLVVAVAGQGVVLAGPSEAFVAAMEETLLAHVLVRRLIARRGEAVTLPRAECAALAGMEAEKHRQAMAGAV
jgi:rhamnose utilization protein RhaD (predicted bifunctional aldolase and dehydrogenase)